MQKLTVIVGECECSILLPKELKEEALADTAMGLFDLTIPAQGFTKDVVNAIEWEKTKVKRNVIDAIKRWTLHPTEKNVTRFVLPDMARKILVNESKSPDTTPPSIEIVCQHT